LPGVSGELGEIEETIFVRVHSFEVLIAMMTHLGDFVVDFAILRGFELVVLVEVEASD
jgi:hypothetical protein